jgi:hypothetical protein
VESTVTDIALEIYRVFTLPPEFGIQFDQFLGKAEVGS